MKGMRFWIPCKFLLPGLPPITSEEPFRGKRGGLSSDRVMIAERSFPNLYLHGKKGFTIRGEIFIDEPGAAKKLIEHPGILRFDPQEAVDLGLMACDDMLRLGYSVSPPAKPVTMVPAAPRTSMHIPDLDVMTKDEIVDWCGENDVVVDARLRKPEMLERLRKQLGE